MFGFSVILRSAVLACVAVLLLGAQIPGQSQAGGGVAEPDVEVRASIGPALWHITRGSSELVILGTIAPTPDAARWNVRAVTAAIDGAGALLLSPNSAPGFAWADSFPRSRFLELQQPYGRTLSKELSVDLHDKLAEVTATYGLPMSRYEGLRPGPAGMRLLEDVWLSKRWSGDQVSLQVSLIARSLRVPIRRIDEGGALPLLNAMPAMSKDQQLHCFRGALSQIGRQVSYSDEEYARWSNGDLDSLSKTYVPPALCPGDIPGGETRRLKAEETWLKALQVALRTPGRTVAVMDVHDVLHSGFLHALGPTDHISVSSRADVE